MDTNVKSPGVNDGMGVERWLGCSPSSFIQIGPKLPKFVIGVDWLGWAKRTPSHTIWGVVGWLGGLIFILEENLTCQVMRKQHTKFQLCSSKRLEIIPCLKLETIGDNTLKNFLIPSWTITQKELSLYPVAYPSIIKKERQYVDDRGR